MDFEGSLDEVNFITVHLRTLAYQFFMDTEMEMLDSHQ